MTTAELDLIIIVADRANFARLREYCASAGHQTLERFERSSPLADFAVMKLSATARTCQLAWATGTGGLLSGIRQLYTGSAEFTLLLAQAGRRTSGDVVATSLRDRGLARMEGAFSVSTKI
jgi:hypothetical protein